MGWHKGSSCLVFRASAAPRFTRTVCAPPAHLQGVAPTLLPWFPSCAEAVKLGLPQGPCRAGRWAQGWGPGMALPSCHLQLPPVPSTSDPPPAAEGMFSPRSVVTRRFDGSSSCQFLRAPHSQWHPEPSPHVGDGEDPAGSGQVTGDHPESLS